MIHPVVLIHQGHIHRDVIALIHCITQKNQIFTRSPVLVHRHVHSTDLHSHCLTQENHLESSHQLCCSEEAITLSSFMFT